MLIHTRDLLVKNIPHKKMSGYLKSQKINPDLIAVSISDDRLSYQPIDWKNYLPHSHKVIKIILCKVDNLFLFVGYSKDYETIIYNEEFSRFLLFKESKIEYKIEKKISKPKSCFNESELIRLNPLLDKISKSGIDSLSKNELNELDYLSKKLNNQI